MARNAHCCLHPPVNVESCGGVHSTEVLDAPRNSLALVLLLNSSLPNTHTFRPFRPEAYDGQLAYAYAKRGQVLLAEEWAKREASEQHPQPPHIKFLSCHPGWVATPGVDAAYGKAGAWLLAPLRTGRQGGEGVAWLAAVAGEELEPGGFYLDRAPQLKHLPGGWFLNRGGKATHNTAEEAAELVPSLEQIVVGSGGGDSSGACLESSSSLSK